MAEIETQISSRLVLPPNCYHLSPIIHTVALLSVDHKERLLKEVILMLTFDHPNVMSLIGLSFDREMPLIVMPFMSKGNILGYVRGNRECLYFKDLHEHEQVRDYHTT